MADKDWFRIKKYPHIGLPITGSDRNWVTKYVQNRVKIASHGFYPFIHRATTVRRFRKKIEKNGKKSKLRYRSQKPRELFYASHLDAYVFSYYAKLVNEFYEEKIRYLGIDDCITAYRRIPLDPSNNESKHKSNSDFASEVFNFILNNLDDNLIAITFDIKSFFDTLSHKKLKKSLCQILDVKTLDDDYYNVFKNICHFSYVNENQIFNEFKSDIIVETKSGIRKRKKVTKQRYLRNQNAIAFCHSNEFEKRVLNKGLVVKNEFHDLITRSPRMVGIPQGSPISAALANIYMLNFDYEIASFLKSINGLYKRYSDDMVIVCDSQYEQDIIKLFHTAIKERELVIQDEKTQIFRFKKVNGKYSCDQKIDGNFYSNKNFEYLGFEFDGFHTYIKSSSLSGYYRKMKRAINRGLFYSKIDKEKNGIFRSRLYKKYSYKGASRRQIYVKDKLNPNSWIKTERHDWGNFISYAFLAQNKLPNNKIKNQVKRHWKILNQLIR